MNLVSIKAPTARIATAGEAPELVDAALWIIAAG
jgi:hypothetical protein